MGSTKKDTCCFFFFFFFFLFGVVSGNSGSPFLLLRRCLLPLLLAGAKFNALLWASLALAVAGSATSSSVRGFTSAAASCWLAGCRHWTSGARCKLKISSRSRPPRGGQGKGRNRSNCDSEEGRPFGWLDSSEQNKAIEAAVASQRS